MWNLTSPLNREQLGVGNGEVGEGGGPAEERVFYLYAVYKELGLTSAAAAEVKLPGP